MINNFKLGVIDSPVDLRDYTYDMIAGSSSRIKIPKSFTLDYSYHILNQGSVGSCVAHALASMKSYIDGVQNDDFYSIGFIYGYRQEDDHQGSGMITREALSNLVKFGDCRRTSFPVNEEYPDIVETMARYKLDRLIEEAAEHMSLAYVKLYLDDVKEYIVKYEKPVLVTVRVYDNFYDANTNGGIIPSEPEGNHRGGHAMLCVGYDGDTLKLINSWGDYNGDKGIYYLDLYSDIIKELWVLEDEKKIKQPEVIKYTVGWNKYILNNQTKWMYSRDGKTLVSNEWIQLNGLWYYLDNSGYALSNTWYQYKNDWYYLKDDCSMTTGWLKIDTDWYYLDLKSGAMITGWFKDTDGKVYYLEPESGKNKGHMYKDCDWNIDGKFHHFNSSGEMDKIY